MAYHDKRGRIGSRLCVKLVDGERVPLLPEGVCEAIGIDGRNWPRVRDELRADGCIRQWGEKKGHIRLFVYIRPTRMQEICSSGLMNKFRNSPKINILQIHFVQDVVKRKLRSATLQITRELFAEPAIAAKCSSGLMNTDQVLQAVDDVLLFIRRELKNRLLFIAAENAYKEENYKNSQSSQKIVVVENSSVVEEPPPTTTKTEATPPAEAIAQPSPGDASEDEIARARRILMPVCPSCPDAEILRPTLRNLPATDNETLDAFRRFLKVRRFRSNGLLPRLAQQYSEAEAACQAELAQEHHRVAAVRRENARRALTDPDLPPKLREQLLTEYPELAKAAGGAT